METFEPFCGWLLSKTHSLPTEFVGVATLGSGPIEEKRFDEILKGLNYRVLQTGKLTKRLVIGREGWSTRTLDLLLDARAGQSLRVYSQEMFLAYLISGVDPLDEDVNTIRLLAGYHPALAYLDSAGFSWPTTAVPEGPRKTEGESADLLEVGLLKYLGYRVGHSGVRPRARRQVLRDIYRNPVPPVFPQDYVEKWGQPLTAKRLLQLAGTLARLCKNLKRRDISAAKAIREYESDLRWLKERYYKGSYRFRWPHTDVW